MEQRRKILPGERVCQICGKDEHTTEIVPAVLVRPAVAKIIKEKYPEWSSEWFICMDDLNHYRNEYVRTLLELERGELSSIEQEVVDSLRTHELLASHVTEEFESHLTFGQRLSDRIASFGGSWKFIMIFAGVLCVWMFINTVILIKKPFDPYPFILLNLVLSCLAAIQAPIIMMSQNRQEAKDRLRATHDYKINLKAELEIRQLHQKIDHVLSHQWERLVEIQEIQLDLIEEIRKYRSKELVPIKPESSAR
ncbi:hypothetical protein U27_00821 [Candidatus Vecturithrix granuli]|uniref:DUF1003 domain-containing protein n=1 Tax=Vecturithrix granuli TaxID=1499967 RepID=A0A081C8L8_VECG1|nr:hypothetical protein U27_00821 [Candidatus Vecturithrix granuli]